MELLQDTFISHATRDNESYIQPLTLALSERNISFWLDTILLALSRQVASVVNRHLYENRPCQLCL
jgi:hypothetical protein